MGNKKKNGEKAGYMVSTAQHDSLKKQIKKLIQTHADWVHYELNEDMLDLYVEEIKKEELAAPMVALLKKSHKSQGAKAGAVLARAAHDGFPMSRKKVQPHKADNKKQEKVVANKREAPSKFKAKGPVQESEIEGLDLYQPTLAQFTGADIAPLPVLRSADEVKPGARGIILLKGSTLMEVFVDKMELFRDYSQTLIVLLPVAKFEKMVGNNPELHEVLQPQMVQVVAIDPTTKGGFRPLTAWAMSLSREKLKVKMAMPTMQIQIDKQVDLVLQVKKGIVPPEVFDALKTDTRREFQSVWECLVEGVSDQPPVIHKAFQKWPQRNGGKEYEEPTVIQAHVEVAEKDLSKYLALSGKHGVFVQLAGYYTEHAVASTIIPLPDNLAMGEARDWVMEKTQGDISLGVVPMRSDWKRFALRVPSGTEEMMHYQEKILPACDAAARNFAIKAKFVVGNIPRGTDMDQLIQQLRHVHGWQVAFLKQIRDSNNPNTAVAAVVGAVEGPPSNVIINGPVQMIVRAFTTDGKPESKPAQWTCRTNRWNKRGDLQQKEEKVGEEVKPTYLSKAVKALNLKRQGEQVKGAAAESDDEQMGGGDAESSDARPAAEMAKKQKVGGEMPMRPGSGLPGISLDVAVMPELPNDVVEIQKMDMMAAMMDSMKTLMEPIINKIDNIGAKQDNQAERQSLIEAKQEQQAEVNAQQVEMMKRLGTRLDQQERQNNTDELGKIPTGARGRSTRMSPLADSEGSPQKIRSRSERRNGRSRSSSSAKASV